VSGGIGRLTLLVASLAVAGPATALLLPLASDWHGEQRFRPPGFAGHP
jgi:hypothetical protein